MSTLKLKKILPKRLPNNAYTCSVITCGRIYSTKHRLNLHLRSHDPEKPFRCQHPNCDKSFKTKFNLRMHTRVHEVKNFVCIMPECSERFHTDRNLTYHLQHHHEYFEDRYKCDFPDCTETFLTRAAAVGHKKIHLKPRVVLKCHLCEKEFTNKCRLDAHLRDHEKARKYPCPEEGCPWSFERPSKLERHMVTHEDRPSRVAPEINTCPHPDCNWKSNRMDRLKSHLKSHEKKSLCPIGTCTVALPTLEEINSHIDIEHSSPTLEEEGSSGRTRGYFDFKKKSKNQITDNPVLAETPSQHINLVSLSPDRRDDQSDVFLSSTSGEEMMDQGFALPETNADFEHSTINLRDLE